MYYFIIKSNNPIIIGLWQNVLQQIGHAVVLTNLSYKESCINGKNYLSEIYVLDPENDKQNVIKYGLKSYKGEDISEKIKSFLTISISVEEFY